MFFFLPEHANEFKEKLIKHVFPFVNNRISTSAADLATSFVLLFAEYQSNRSELVTLHNFWSNCSDVKLASRYLCSLLLDNGREELRIIFPNYQTDVIQVVTLKAFSLAFGKKFFSFSVLDQIFLPLQIFPGNVKINGNSRHTSAHKSIFCWYKLHGSSRHIDKPFRSFLWQSSNSRGKIKNPRSIFNVFQQTGQMDPGRN